MQLPVKLAGLDKAVDRLPIANHFTNNAKRFGAPTIVKAKDIPTAILNAYRLE